VGLPICWPIDRDLAAADGFFVTNTLRGCLQKGSRRSPSPDLSSAAETTSQAALCLEALIIEQAKRARESPASVGHEHSAPPLAGAYRGEVAEQTLPDQARRPAASRIGHGLVAGPYHDTADTITARLDPHVDAILRIRPDAEQPILSLRGRYRHSQEQRGYGHKHKGCRLEHIARISQRLRPAPATLHSPSITQPTFHSRAQPKKGGPGRAAQFPLARERISNGRADRRGSGTRTCRRTPGWSGSSSHPARPHRGRSEASCRTSSRWPRTLRPPGRRRWCRSG